MGGDERRSERTSSRGHKSSRHRSSRHKSSRDKERTSGRSGSSTPGAHPSVGTSDSGKESQLMGNPPRNTSGFTDDDMSFTTNSSFDPIALANERTNYYARQQSPKQTSKEKLGAQHQTLIGTAEAPSRDAKRLSGGYVTSPKRADAVLSPSMTKSRPSSNKSSNGMGNTGMPPGAYEHTVIAHQVTPVDLDGGTIDKSVERLAEENRLFREQMQAQNEAERLRLLEENNRIQQEMRENLQREKEAQEAEAAAKQKKQSQIVKVVLCLLVVAGIGVGAYFGTRSSSSDSTQAPTAPKDADSLYEPPTTEECETMGNGLPRGNDHQGLLYRQFDMIIHAQVSPEVSSASTVSADLLSSLKQQIERLLRPNVVGCSTTRRRNLALAEAEQSRRELNDLKYLIYDFEVSLAQDTESTCTLGDQSTEPCHVLVASMDVWLQGDQPDLLVRGHVFELLNTLDLPVTLGLESRFDVIMVTDVRDPSNLTPTGSPSISPVSNPTVSPVQGTGGTPSSGTCDLSENFNGGFYYEHDGGIDQTYVVDCSTFTGNRAIALAVDESTCEFSCVGRKEPQAFGLYCAAQPAGTTIQLVVGGDNTGSKIYLGTDSNDSPEGALDCDPPLTIVTPDSNPTVSPVQGPSNVAAPTGTPSNAPTMALSQEPTSTPPPTPSPPPTAGPGDTPSTGTCDLSANFNQGFYYEQDGGVDQTFVADCSIFTGTRAIALAVDESTCEFSCVGRKEPQAFGPYCARQPAGTTIELVVDGDNTGSKVYLGTDTNDSPDGALTCNPPLTIVS